MQKHDGNIISEAKCHEKVTKCPKYLKCRDENEFFVILCYLICDIFHYILF